MTMHVKVAGVWKEIIPAHVKVSGVWKDIEEGYVRVAGVWKLFYRAVTVLMDATRTITSSDTTGNAIVATF